MSRAHRKNLKRGDKQPLVHGTQHHRASRHGQPQMWRGTKAVKTMVAPGTPGAERAIEEIQPGVVYPEGTVLLDGVAVVHYATVEVPCWVMSEPGQTHAQRVAAGPTGTYGSKNTGGASAGRKAVKKD